MWCEQEATISGNKDEAIRLNRVARYKMSMTNVMNGDDTHSLPMGIFRVVREGIVAE